MEEGEEEKRRKLIKRFSQSDDRPDIMPLGRRRPSVVVGSVMRWYAIE